MDDGVVVVWRCKVIRRWDVAVKARTEWLLLCSADSNAVQANNNFMVNVLDDMHVSPQRGRHGDVVVEVMR